MILFSIHLTNEFCGLYEFVMLSNMEGKLCEFLQCLLSRRNLAFEFEYLALLYVSRFAMNSYIFVGCI